jgi:hypothetical protein
MGIPKVSLYYALIATKKLLMSRYPGMNSHDITGNAHMHGEENTGSGTGFVDLFLEAHRRVPEQIILDLDRRHCLTTKSK